MKVTSREEWKLGAKRPKGFGESFPLALQGLSRSDWD